MTCYTRNNRELYGLWTGWTTDGGAVGKGRGHKAAAGRRHRRPAELLMRGCRATQEASI